MLAPLMTNVRPHGRVPRAQIVRVEEAEAQVQHLRGDMTNFSRRQLDALWMRAQQEVDDGEGRAQVHRPMQGVPPRGAEPAYCAVP